ncbi:MAG TPA: hypothetical protein DDZ80_01880 [Cyanobacteria bacterium UBA8803]|nr:hypothetical protein [Cyanobacteria bacterium UBA9273]HBL57344.1 hypothetical protein [Cyanobacteria bacterium UBA8803]
MDSYLTNTDRLDTTPLRDEVLNQAVEFLTTLGTTAPAPAAVVEALLMAEKTAKQAKVCYAWEQLHGTWRLGFITGTKKSRQRAGVILGAGRFLPKWVKIHLSYLQSEPGSDRGTVENSVALGLLQIVLTGPTQFWPKMNILTFDFTRMRVLLSGRQLYSGYIRGGQERERSFYQQKVKQQAFFTYFLVQDQYIAARGRGGGLALWTRASV